MADAIKWVKEVVKDEWRRSKLGVKSIVSSGGSVGVQPDAWTLPFLHMILLPDPQYHIGDATGRKTGLCPDVQVVAFATLVMDSGIDWILVVHSIMLPLDRTIEVHEPWDAAIVEMLLG